MVSIMVSIRCMVLSIFSPETPAAPCGHRREDFQGGGQVVAQKAVELVGLLGVAALVLEHLGGDDADAVDLLIQLGVVDVRVDGADFLQNGVLRVLRRFLLGGLLLLLGGSGMPSLVSTTVKASKPVT